jgi:hypothetical protein
MAGLVIDIEPDPTWEPFDIPDVLEQDGYYCCRIVREGARSDSSKSPGIFLTLEIQDADAQGKRISKFLSDPRTTKSDTKFVWRNIIRSITGTLDAARAGFRYVPGAFANQIIYVRTGAYAEGDSMRTGVETFVTKDEYDQAVAGKKHRWTPKPKGDRTALPTGLPGAFPAASGFPGMPGAPSGATPSVPAPPSAAPMQQAPQPQMPQQPPQQGFGGGGFAAPPQPQQPQAGFAPPPPIAPAPATGFPGFGGQAAPAITPQPPPPAGSFPPGTFPGQR